MNLVVEVSLFVLSGWGNVAKESTASLNKLYEDNNMASYFSNA